jgi:hypothetical protein
LGEGELQCADIQMDFTIEDLEKADVPRVAGEGTPDEHIPDSYE